MTLFDEPDVGPARVSLVRLASLITRAVGGIGRFVVEGEVHRPSSGPGRQWFTLKDRASQISVSVPAGRRPHCRVVDGERVAATGRLEWVPGWGQLQVVAEEVVPVGEGAIAAMIAEARRRLDADGLLARPRRPIPRLPTAIGVVCGREAAVQADIESVVAARFPGYPVVFLQTTVSGAGAPQLIVDAIRDLDRRTEVEVIVLARGGGDATQLLPFSDENVCRAVCATRAPVVSAIGHDGDRPLVDEVADLRCGTPSIAAASVVPSRSDLGAELDGWLHAARAALLASVERRSAALRRVDRDEAVRACVDRAARRLDAAGSTLPLVHPARDVTRSAARLQRIDWRSPVDARIHTARRSLAALGGQAEALAPHRVLERGYAVVRLDDGRVVRDPAEVRDGAPLDITVAGGALRARAER